MSNPKPGHPAKAVEIAVRVEDWLIVDATLDNTVDLAAEGGQQHGLEQGQLVRATGWEAAGRHPLNGKGPAGWPPQDDELRITLPVAAWRFVVNELHRWDPIEAGMASGSEDKPASGGHAIALYMSLHCT